MMHSMLLFSQGDIAGFKRAGEEAVRLNPNNSIAVAHLGFRLSLIGEWDLGRALIKKALALNPFHPSWFRFAEVFYRYDRSEYELVLAELGKMDMPNFFWFHLIRAATLGQMDRLDEAELATQELLRLVPEFRREATGLIKVWQLPKPLVESVLDGLSKASLEIIMEPAPEADQ